MLSKRSIITKTIQVGGTTFLSRMLGVVREVLLVHYLGAGALSDAFITAFKIPNSLRKIFAEGALTASFIPTLVGIVRSGHRHEVNRLIALAFLLFEGAVLIICALSMIFARFVIVCMAPGFSVEQVERTVPLLQIVMPFIFFISTSALIAGALQSVGHFFVPAFSPVFLNVVFITSLIICITNAFPVQYFCWFILLGGLLQCILHIIAYYGLQFAFERPDEKAWHHMKTILIKFVPSLIGMSILEISLIVDSWFASFLPAGSISLLHYGSRFLGIPLGIFAVALSTILLPHFSRVTLYAPKRLSFYLLETTKLIFWATIPVALMMGFFAEKIFHTIFLSQKFSLEQVVEAQHILIALLIGLSFFSLNKILVNVYYALHVTWVPMVVSFVGTLFNITLNYLFMGVLQATGLALATTISGIIQTALFIVFLVKVFNFRVYSSNIALFLVRYVVQLVCTFFPFWLLYGYITKVIVQLPDFWSHFLLYSIGFWLWVGPLCLAAVAILFITRRLFGLTIYFVE